jgi:hypothetical protein
MGVGELGSRQGFAPKIEVGGNSWHIHRVWVLCSSRGSPGRLHFMKSIKTTDISRPYHLPIQKTLDNDANLVEMCSSLYSGRRRPGPWS